MGDMSTTLSNQVTLAAECIELQAEEGGPRRFTMEAYTGVPVARLFGPMILDLEGFKLPDKLPMLLNHDADAVVGYADKLELGHETLRLSGVILEDEAAGARVARLGKAGFPLTASVGVRVDKWEELRDGDSKTINGREVSGPMSVAAAVHLFETSFITAGPADSDTSAQVLARENSMDPKAFEEANPEQVLTWKADGVQAARESLAEILSSLPEDRRGWAAQRFCDGMDLTQIKAELADVVLAELAEAKTAAAQNADANADAAVVAKLEQAAGSPGVGFNGAARQTGDAEAAAVATLTTDERIAREWSNDPAIRAEFGGNQNAFTIERRRELAAQES